MAQSAYTVTLDLADGGEVSKTVMADTFDEAKDKVVALYPSAVGGMVEASNGWTEFTL